MTAFLGILDPLTLALSYASVGHPPPLLRRGDGSVVELAAIDLPLGLRNERGLEPRIASACRRVRCSCSTPTV